MQFLPLHQLIESQAHATPDKCAILFDGRQTSYSELVAAADAVAHCLRQHGAKPGTRVGLHVERSVSMVAAMLGICKAGGAYVPLDPAYPAERLLHIVRDARLDHVLYSKTPPFADEVRHCLDIRAAQVPARELPAPAAGPLRAQDPAYVIYTSGSTGKPKGVQVHHGALLNFLHSMRQRPGLSKDEVLLAVTTPAFDISVLELFLPLMVGASIVLATREQTLDAQGLAGLITAHGVTVMQATPSTWRMLFRAGWPGSPTLRVFCGGEVLDAPLATRLLAGSQELWNLYGPTETTVWSTCGRVVDPAAPISVGHPIDRTILHILDEAMRPVDDGTPGEVYIGGAGVALGYTDPALTRARFVADPFSSVPGARLYRTGDRGMRSTDGALFVLGRLDDQVKVRGHRIELNEVRQAVLECAGVEQAAVVCVKDALDENELVAFVVNRSAGTPGGHAIKAHVAGRLPAYMVPARIVELGTLPLTPNGKIDRNALAASGLARADLATPADLPSTDPHSRCRALVCHLLGVSEVDPDSNLFDLGLDSLRANHLAATLSATLGRKVSVGQLFQHPSINALLAQQEQAREAETLLAQVRDRVRRAGPAAGDAESAAIAIIGMAGRFPGADSLHEFWQLLAQGRDTVTRFAPSEDDPCVETATRAHVGYVRARGMIGRPDMFDAAFFGISPNEAAVMDPQQRVFLELAWEALEHAGQDPGRFEGLVGVYAGMGNNFYYIHNVSTRPELIRMVGEVQVEVGREKDHIATLVSHKLDLTGPSLSIHTACSTGLVNIDAACQALLSGQCDMALAGAIELRTPQMSGQVHEPGGIFTADGHCRPFSDDASGTMFSDGAGVVVLKRLQDALRDGDTVHALVRGSAVNHDGLKKKSYLAPSVAAQMKVIAMAQARAGVTPDTITYMEAHGTATPVGDPIEFQALKAVFESGGAKRNHCALGSVKGNLGHPTTAAGVVGVIKTALALKQQQIPPLANFRAINPNIDIANSPFYINSRLIPWPRGDTARRAGISSFGFCGTNAHVVLEEAPPQGRTGSRPARPHECLPLSAATESALQQASGNLVAHLAEHPAARTCDVAFTLATGRKALKYRRCVVVKGTEAAAAPEMSGIRRTPESPGRVGFIFPGQGSQYFGMGRGLYATEPAFRAALDQCADLLRQQADLDLHDLVIGTPGDSRSEAERKAALDLTHITQPALFAIEYALARLWQAWGIHPEVVAGHSVGEYVCGVLAGCFSLADGIRLVAARGRLMGQCPRGSMLSVRMPAAELQRRLPPALDIAAVNGPQLCVAAGPQDAMDDLQARLAGEGILCRRLHTSHAFHSSMMDSAVEPFMQVVQSVRLSPPVIPIISTVTGVRLTDPQACDPGYWATHIRLPVRFAQALETLWQDEHRVLLEVGPRASLTTLATAQRRHPQWQAAVPSLGDTSADGHESLAMARALGLLWMQQVDPDWIAYLAGYEPRRIPLPTYPFERHRFWVEPAAGPQRGEPAAAIGIGHPPHPSQTDRASPAQALQGDRDCTVVRELRGILESVSGRALQDVPTSATFFEMGLDSLLLTPVIYLVKERYGVSITFRQLISELSTLDALARHLVGASGPGTCPTAVPDPAPSAEAVATVETTQAQRRILQASRPTQHGPLAQVESVTLELVGGLDKEALVSALQWLTGRHDALRAAFPAGAGHMHVLPASAVRLPIRWLTVKDQAVAGHVAEELQHPFDETQAPLFRCLALQSEGARHRIVLTAHSAVCDGWSLDVLIEELAEAYNATVRHQPARAPSAGQFLDHARRHQEFLRSESAGLQRAFWARYRRPGSQGAAERHATPSDCGPNRPPRLSATVSKTVLDALKAAGAGVRCSIFTLLLGGLEAPLAACLGAKRTEVAVPVAGQSSANEPRLVGQCTNWVPVLLEPQPGRPAGASLQALQDQWISAYENQHWQGDALPDISFTHTKRLSGQAHAFDGLQATYWFNRKPVLGQAMALEVTEYEDHLVVQCDHTSGLAPGKAERLLAAYCDALASLPARLAPPLA